MKTMTSSLVCIATAAAALAGAGAVNAATVVNGGFGSCQPHCPTNGTPLSGGSGQLTDWTISSSDGGNASQAVEWVNASGWTAQSGVHSIALSGANEGTVSETIATKVGFTYDVAFYVSGPYKQNGNQKVIAVDVAGLPTQDFTYTDESTSNSNMAWKQEIYQFTATSTSSTLSLWNTNVSGATKNEPGLYGMALDSVSISTVRVPEPATWAMMILGTGLLGGTLRRRNRALASVAA
jgi:hypothetical protein